MPLRLPNYQEDRNPFHLAGPPNWFLHQLWDFDASLAIVPSRQGFYYRLAQRRPLELPEKVVNDVLKEQADTAMLASYGLVPVTTILATANWGNPLIFVELARRAPWRMGGAEQYEKAVIGQERQERLDAAIQQDAELTDRAKDGWRYYNKKIGTRSHIFDVVPVGKPKAKTPATPALIVPSTIKAYTPLVTTSWGNPNTP